jgi:thioester reductase-like protein
LDQPTPNSGSPGRPPRVYWRVEGSLLDLTTVEPVAFFTWNAQTFAARMVRRGLVFLMAALRPLLYATNRVFATRVVHSVLRGVSRDRLDALGIEYFHYKLKPYLKPKGVAALKQLQASGAEIVLVSQGLDHVMQPLAKYLGVHWMLVNRLDFRERIATGRLLTPVIRPRGLFARITGAGPDGRREPQRLVKELGLASVQRLQDGVVSTGRRVQAQERPVIYFDGAPHLQPFSVRRALGGKHVMLIGVTGFIGKVWLANTLMDLPEIGKIYLLIRRQKSNPAVKRFEKMVEESPVFDPLHDRYGLGLARFLQAKVEVVEGDVTAEGLGLGEAVASRLRRDLDVIINSSGLTDFNPDLRDALATNVDAAVNVASFIRSSDHCGLVHLSTCYVAGARDGRVSEKLRPNYTPLGLSDFDAKKEWRALHKLVEEAEAKAESSEVTAELREQAMGKEHAARDLQGAALENQIRKNRIRWLRGYLTDLGMQRARELGWPNTYTLSKSLAESLLIEHGADLPIAVVRPAIVETSIRKPFLGWNEGINTSASLSYLLGTNFRQLPSNERKRLDLIPVDSVCQGITLIAAAVAERRHDAMYQLATSVTNPCDMGRSIELTSLAHRKHYRAQEGLESWLLLHMDAIPVSKRRYKRMSAPAQKAIVQSIQRIMAPLASKKPLAKTERGLERVEKLVDLFEPFILHNEHDFVADNVEKLSHALVEEERETFGYDTRSLDWWEYWIDIHIPALRRWTYPLIEGRPLEVRAARSLSAVNVTLPAEDSARVADADVAETVKTGTDGATWRFS